LLLITKEVCKETSLVISNNPKANALLLVDSQIAITN